MILALIVIGAVLFGYVLGRPSALLGAFVLGAVMAAIVDPWEVSKLYVGLAWVVVGVIGVGAGVILRGLLRPRTAGAPSTAGRSRS